jgi:rhodanese-related sulfurtransferase
VKIIKLLETFCHLCDPSTSSGRQNNVDNPVMVSLSNHGFRIKSGMTLDVCSHAHDEMKYKNSKSLGHLNPRLLEPLLNSKLRTLNWFLLILMLFAIAPVRAEAQLPERISPKELASLLQEKKAVAVNVMSEIECLDHRIPGSLCIACEEFAKKADALPKAKDTLLVLYCESERCWRSCLASQQAREMGYSRVAVLQGGLPAWKKEGYKTESVERIPRAAIQAVRPRVLNVWLKEKKDILIVDIRSEDLFRKSRIEGSINIPLHSLHRRYQELPINRLFILVDENGNHSFLASSYLVRKGFWQVRRLFGGMARWENFLLRQKGKGK